MKITGRNKFYTFYQNNSGGNFISNHTLKEYVIIEAHSADEANEIAQDIGIYFNGVCEGRDCECCGDRWYSISSSDKGTFEPTIYNQSLNEYNGYKDYIIYYKDGTTKNSN